uniref:DUF8039 domain-containing protein n=1 Tax=Chenopodium quinoa TaxID=63459 RepID=A0A803MZ06_CHEQI
MEGKGIIGCKEVDLTYEDWNKAHTYILFNEEEVAPYIEKHLAYLAAKNRKANKKSLHSEHNRSFSTWLKDQAKEFLRKGIHVDEVPRHETWLRAHAHVKDGIYTFSNPIDEVTANAINELKGQAERGEVVFHSRRDDILARALKKPERGGHVRGGGGFLGIPNGQHGQFNDHVNGNFGGINYQSQIMRVGSQSTAQGISLAMANLEHTNGFFTQLLSGDINGQVRQVSSPELPSFEHEEQEKEPEQADPYHVSWPTKDNVPYNEQLDQSPQHKNSAISWSEIDNNLHISDLPEGMHDCCLAIEDNKEIMIVATGQVYIPGKNLAVKNHFFDVSTENRRVSIINDIEPTALLPCPIQDFLYIYEAKETFVPWPAHLIFPKKKLEQEKEDTSILQSSPKQASSEKEYIIDDADRAKCPRQPIGSKVCGYYVCRYMLETIESRGQVVPPKYFPRVPTTYSEEMNDEIRDTWVTYVLKQKQVNNYKSGENGS